MSRIPHKFYGSFSKYFKYKETIKSLDWEKARIGVDSYDAIGYLPPDSRIKKKSLSFVIVADVNGVLAYE